jgi:hypothetical protein
MTPLGPASRKAWRVSEAPADLARIPLVPRLLTLIALPKPVPSILPEPASSSSICRMVLPLERLARLRNAATHTYRRRNHRQIPDFVVISGFAAAVANAAADG